MLNDPLQGNLRHLSANVYPWSQQDGATPVTLSQNGVWPHLHPDHACRSVLIGADVVVGSNTLDDLVAT